MTVPSLSALADLGTRAFWRATGRPVDLTGEHAWLTAPMNVGSVVEDAWVENAAELLGGQGAEVVRGRQEAGLMASMADLDGLGFDAARLQPAVRDFYEHTAAWRMEPGCGRCGRPGSTPTPAATGSRGCPWRTGPASTSRSRWRRAMCRSSCGPRSRRTVAVAALTPSGRAARVRPPGRLRAGR